MALGLRFPGPPREVRVEERVIGAVACEILTPPGAATDQRRLLYLHGGGWT